MMDGDPRSILISMTLHGLNLAKDEAAEKERRACEKIVRDEMAEGPLSTRLGKVADAIAARKAKP